ncbi:MAG TPA: signal recognition particle protein [Polyangiaceae bacterium]|nr:signal recognition particle protein [Polyangiaceae bacterium]
MFDALKRGFREAQNRLAGLTELNSENIKPALLEVRTSLLEADVELGVVKRFLARVEERALGQTVRTSVKHGGQKYQVSASDQFIKVCHDEMVELMSFEGDTLKLDAKPAQVMMVGLQGSGKTTTSAKLARRFKSEGRKPLLVAADMQRPAAVEQLKVLGEQIGVPVFNLPEQTPLAITKAAAAEAQKLGCDTIIYDTAGRLAIDETLMQELSDIKSAVAPENILLVVDAMIGQDAVRTAASFNERLGISGVILTKLDGDARGGAALSVKEVTGAPIVFTGTGETTDRLEEFRPDGMAGRVLGFGDVVGLMKDFEEVVDQKKAEEDAARMLSGEFTLEDFLQQVRMIQQMGPLKDLVEKIPGMGGMMPPGAELDGKEFRKIEAMIQSMTRAEKRDAQLLVREPGRAQRVAQGSGTPVEAVNELVQKFVFIKQMMGNMGGAGGLLGKLPGMKGLAMARNLRRAAKSGKMPAGMPGGFPGMPGGFPGMPGGFPGMPGGFPGMPGGFPMGADALGAGESTPKMKVLSRSEKNARKGQRKRERNARKKNRGKN